MSESHDFPLQSSNFTDQLGDQALVGRANALDAFLTAQLGEPWSSVSRSTKPLIHEGDGPISRDYWEFFLFAISAAKYASPEPHLEAIHRLFAEPRVGKLAELTSSDGKLSLIIARSHAAIVEDLSTAWHPGWEGAEIYPENSVEQSTLQQIMAALDLITKASSAATSLVSETCKAACLLGTKGMDRGSCTSLTSKFVPGLIYFTPAPIILTSESIVHEAAHLWLSRLESARELYNDPHRKVASPLRKDARPVSGLMHQVWVLSNLVPYYDSLKESKLPLVITNYDKVVKRREAHASDLTAGLLTLAENEDALTPAGQSFIASIAPEVHVECP
jgi:hypothetical protein